MNQINQTRLTEPARATADAQPGRRKEEVTYQVVTICAILLVLGSLWIF